MCFHSEISLYLCIMYYKIHELLQIQISLMTQMTSINPGQPVNLNSMIGGQSWSFIESLTFTTFWANSADDKLILPENRL